MRIVFGWNLDRAPWTTDDTGTTVVTGPLGMLGILQTRLGTPRPTVDRSIRIAQYRALLERADHPWYRQSFLSDPWQTAQHLLALRDDAIEAGWDPNLDDVDYSAHPRLEALSKVEGSVVLGPSHDTDATLAAGRADDLREVLEILRLHGAEWPLGISSLELRDQRDALPRVWQDIFNAAESAGIAVTESVTNSSTPDLAIVRGRDEWSTAEAAARYLAHLPNRDRLCIIAGDSTSVLDPQLARRETPTLGIPSSNSTSPSAQVLPVFLSAVLFPTDIRRVADFLRLSFSSNGGDSHEKKLVPHAVSTALLNALAQEPGISADHASAWMTALRTIEDRALSSPETSTAAWNTAKTLDELLRVSPPLIRDDELAISSLTPALDWLSTRLRRLSAHQPPKSEGAPTADTQTTTDTFIVEAAGHLDSLRAALGKLGTESLRTRELFDIVESCAPTSAQASVPAQAAKWTVVAGPSEVPTGTDTIIWWSSRRSDTAADETWDPAEVDALGHAGADIATAASRERLRQTAELEGLRTASNLVCFCPETRRGEPVALHSTLSRLSEVIAAAHPDRFSSTSVDSVLNDATVTRPIAELFDRETWLLHDVAIPTSTVAREQSTAPPLVSRSLEGGFAHLLPETLSYTQMDQLLSDPQEWVLSRAMGLKRGYTFDVPTDNRMIGTLVHAVVEHLVRSADVINGAEISAAKIASTFNHLVPRFASELLLPGQLARMNAIRSTAVSSITQLFTAAHDRGFTITGAEADFTFDWTLTVDGAPRSIQLRGQRDLEGAFVDGRPVIIDLKWANSAKRYQKLIHDGEAVQLSVYSRTTESSSQTRPLTAYFLLKQGRFVSADPALDPLSSGGADPLYDDGDGLGGDPAGLWTTIEESIEHALSNIAAGRFDSPVADIHAALEAKPGEAGKEVDKAVTEFKKEELAEGRLFVNKSQSFSDFNLIYGIGGDQS
ncbi:hypothetical protein CV023_18475 [Brevibacterium sp. CCUG 69071]|nr:hypothetical protein [Brevibacterium sp. CCUG 69071]